MLGQSLARQAHNRGRGSIDLETTEVTTLAFDAAERLNAHVPDLSRSAINASPELSIKNNPAANPRAERQANDRATTLRCALPHLAESRGVRVIFKQHAAIQFVFKRRAKFVSQQTGNVWRINDHARFRVNRARHHYGSCLNPGATLLAFGLTLS